MSAARAIAPAKLNLTLEVLGRRADGYHDLESVVVQLDLADELTLRPSAKREIVYRGDDGRPVSILGPDIVEQAWDRLLELDRERGWRAVPATAHLEVRKRIPVAGGLGGGSADAAAFLRLARAAWSLPLDDDALRELGAELGSDLPACIAGGPLRMSGRGEQIGSIAAPPGALSGWTALIATPELPVPADKTAAMYRSLRPTHFSAGGATDALAKRLAEGLPPAREHCVNSFDAVADETLQGLRPARRAFGAAVARAAAEHNLAPPAPLLAGAGPSLFAILPPAAAETAAAALRPRWRGAIHVARPLSRSDATRVDRVGG